MSTAWQFYISTVLVYLGVNIIACWALNLQYGVGGVLNFAFIVFQAAGAYTAGVLTLGPASANGGYQHYILGANLPWPLPLLAAGVVGVALAGAVGWITLRRHIRRDYQAMVLLVVSLIATALATTETNVLNGSAGLSSIPKPLEGGLGLSLIGYQWFYVGLTAGLCVIVYLLIHRITASPWGRSLRAMRENPDAAEALGKNVTRLSMGVYMIGGGLAAVSGAVLAEFITAWSPGAWSYKETFVYFTAIIVGGSGNNFGAVLGAVLVPGAFVEAVRFLPSIGYTGLVEALQWIAIGLLVLGFIWFRPKGLLPERRRRFSGSMHGTGDSKAPSATVPAEGVR